LPVEKVVYALESENISGLGGPMGTEQTRTNWTRYFSCIAKAKAAAKEDYERHGRDTRIEWSKSGKGFSSQDLCFVQYHIRACVPEG